MGLLFLSASASILFVFDSALFVHIRLVSILVYFACRFPVFQMSIVFIYFMLIPVFVILFFSVTVLDLCFKCCIKVPRFIHELKAFATIGTKVNTRPMWKNGWHFVLKGKSIIYSSPKIIGALQFLKSLYNHGLSYSTINTAISALLSILKIEGPNRFGSHPLVMRFLKGVYETRKPQPKYTTIWDVATVLKHLKTLWPLQHLSLKLHQSYFSCSC